MGLPAAKVGRALAFSAAALPPLLFMLSVSVGTVNIPLDRVAGALLGGAEGTEGVIVWSYRIPRALASLAAGAALAVNGVVLQALTRNPLASPFTLGLNSAAAFGAALAIVMGVRILGVGDPLALAAVASANAFVTSLVAVAIVLGLARLRGMTPESLILGGIAVAYLFSAATSFLEYISGETQLRIFVLWTMGDLVRVTWLGVYLLLGISAAALLLALSIAWHLNALSLGDETAVSLGTNPRRIRLFGTFAAAFSTAVVVSQVGPIGFICLMSPHIARLMVGADNRYVVPAAAVVGASLLTLADIGARTLMRPAEIPVGVVTAAFGAPFFLALFLHTRRQVWR
jgi:iron complex transport system permease protein